MISSPQCMWKVGSALLLGVHVVAVHAQQPLIITGPLNNSAVHSPFVVTLRLEPGDDPDVNGALRSGAAAVCLSVGVRERCVEIGVDLGAGEHACTVHGSDLTHEYVSINADYRS